MAAICLSRKYIAYKMKLRASCPLTNATKAADYWWGNGKWSCSPKLYLHPQDMFLSVAVKWDKKRRLLCNSSTALSPWEMKWRRDIWWNVNEYLQLSPIIMHLTHSGAFWKDLQQIGIQILCNINLPLPWSEIESLFLRDHNRLSS